MAWGDLFQDCAVHGGRVPGYPGSFSFTLGDTISVMPVGVDPVVNRVV